MCNVSCQKRKDKLSKGHYKQDFFHDFEILRRRCGSFCPYRRRLRADVSAAFPSLSAEDLNELIPNKEELNIVKIYAHKGDAVILYVLHKNPIFFLLEKQLFPTGESVGNSQFLLMMMTSI